MKKIIFILSTTLGIFLLSFNARAQVEVGITITAGIPPPPLPYYEQPYCPADGYIWTPGYWAFEDGDYYWVPGVWVLPPQPGYYWTPCYWAYTGGRYGWHPGYWGPHIGFYGGVDYGYGYYGSGFTGGRWEHGAFRYNTAVLRVNTRVVHNVYVDRTVVVNDRSATRVSFNGGNGGVAARPTVQEQTYVRERHASPTVQQTSHQQMAGRDRNQFASMNHGKPPTVAMNKVGGHAYTPQGRVDNPPARVHPAPNPSAPHPQANQPVHVPRSPAPHPAPMHNPPNQVVHQQQPRVDHGNPSPHSNPNPNNNNHPQPAPIGRQQQHAPTPHQQPQHQQPHPQEPRKER